MKKYLTIQIWLIGVVVFIVANPHGTLAQGSRTFLDEEFENVDWTAGKLVDTTVGYGANFSAYQMVNGGNPGAYRHVWHGWTGDGSGSQGFLVGHFSEIAWHDPGAQGAILGLNVSLDAIFNPATAPWAVACGPLVHQNGHYFTVFGSVTSESWTTLTFEGLTEQDFVGIAGEPLEHPDFSSNGAPIQFGFFTANSTGSSSSLETNSGYDNTYLEITHVVDRESMTWGNIKNLYGLGD
jgi:hypothetical protein